MRAPFLLFLLLAISSRANADGGANFVALADAYLNQKAEEHEFSGTALVAKQGKTLLAKGYGWANREHDIAHSVDTIFRLGSVTKQFTAMCILMLEEDGKLDVHDNICKYIKKCPDSWRDVTIHHLLNHTSGIPSFTEFKDNLQYERLPTTVAETIERFRDLPLEFAPGTKMSYSNSGYVLLGYLIELVSGESYEAFLQARVFKPLGMSRSGYDRPARIIKGRASGYSKDGTEIVNCIPFAMDTPHAAGALYSTVGDLLKWDHALYTDQLLPGDSIAQMFEPFTGETADGSVSSKDAGQYCYGWFKKKRKDRVCFYHIGGISGFATVVMRCPEEHLYIAVLSNFEWADAMVLAEQLWDIELQCAAANSHATRNP